MSMPVKVRKTDFENCWWVTVAFGEGDDVQAYAQWFAREQDAAKAYDLVKRSLEYVCAIYREVLYDEENV